MACSSPRTVFVSQPSTFCGKKQSGEAVRVARRRARRRAAKAPTGSRCLDQDDERHLLLDAGFRVSQTRLAGRPSPTDVGSHRRGGVGTARDSAAAVRLGASAQPTACCTRAGRTEPDTIFSRLLPQWQAAGGRRGIVLGPTPCSSMSYGVTPSARQKAGLDSRTPRPRRAAAGAGGDEIASCRARQEEDWLGRTYFLSSMRSTG